MLSRSVVWDSLWPPWTVAHQAPLSMDFPRQDNRSSPLQPTKVGCHFLLQGIFLTQGSNLCLLPWQGILNCCAEPPWKPPPQLPDWDNPGQFPRIEASIWDVQGELPGHTLVSVESTSPSRVTLGYRDSGVPLGQAPWSPDAWVGHGGCSSPHKSQWLCLNFPGLLEKQTRRARWPLGLEYKSLGPGSPDVRMTVHICTAHHPVHFGLFARAARIWTIGSNCETAFSILMLGPSKQEKKNWMYLLIL